jgi:hypothetical protein
MDLNEVRKFLKDNAGTDEVKSYLSELSKVSPDAQADIIENYKHSQDFRSEIDRSNTQAIKTYNEKTVPTLIEKAVKETTTDLENKYNPPKNPAEEAMRKQLEALTKESGENKKKMIQKELRNIKQALLNSKGIPLEYEDLIPISIDGLDIKDIEDETKLKEMIMPSIEKLFSFGEAAKIAKATEMQIKGSFKPSGSDSQINVGQLTKEAYEALPTREDRVKAQAEGRTKQIMGQQ